MYTITILVIIALWPEINYNIFKSLMISMTRLFTGLQVKGREKEVKNSS
jgi:hypothetical protein